MHSARLVGVQLLLRAVQDARLLLIQRGKALLLLLELRGQALLLRRGLQRILGVAGGTSALSAELTCLHIFAHKQRVSPFWRSAGC